MRTSDLQRFAAREYPEAGEIADKLLAAYQREIGSTMTEVEKYDFRRGAELGYGLAMCANDGVIPPSEPVNHEEGAT